MLKGRDLVSKTRRGGDGYYVCSFSYNTRRKAVIWPRVYFCAAESFEMLSMSFFLEFGLGCLSGIINC